MARTNTSRTAARDLSERDLRRAIQAVTMVGWGEEEKRALKRRD